ncbi:unnamed protein product [Arctogadus glacialis]
MGEVLVARGARTSMDVAASAKDPGFASCSGSSSRETMVGVKAVKVNGSVLDELTDGHLLVYTDHLKAVKAGMEVCFRDLDQLAVPDWVMELLQHDAASSEEASQESIIDLQNNAEAMATFRTSVWRALWLTHGQRFPQLWERFHLLLLVFPTSYLAEQGFSQALHMQSKYRNPLDLVSSGALRLKLTSQCPDVKTLAAGHQP